MRADRPPAPRVKVVAGRDTFVGGVGVQVRHQRSKILLTAPEAIQLANDLADAVEQIETSQ